MGAEALGDVFGTTEFVAGWVCCGRGGGRGCERVQTVKVDAGVAWVDGGEVGGGGCVKGAVAVPVGRH